MDRPPASNVPVETVHAPPPSSSGGNAQLSRPGCGLVLGLVLIAWGVEVADQVFGLFHTSLDFWGIHPRRMLGLLGVFFAPWLHGDWGHLANNTVAFLGLGFLMVKAEGHRFFGTSFILILLSGLGTWLIGRSGTVHVGASGLIYGYFGYLLLRAWTERRPIWIVVGVLVAIFYGTMLVGVLPGQAGISWEGHLCGFVGGLWLGRRHGLQSRQQSMGGTATGGAMP